jgi:DNA replicative helicase MCM subunit Mcm2 (Cdc46/Mcm family)
VWVQAYNTTLFDKASLPTRYGDLLDPKWKGKLGIESKDQEYEEVEITPEDESRIIEEARSEDVFEKIIKSISPTIKGYEEVKEAIALQLFGGSSKQLDDGTKVRGDMHILLVGDPGVAKCVTGDARVMMAGTATLLPRAMVSASQTMPSTFVRPMKKTSFPLACLISWRMSNSASSVK